MYTTLAILKTKLDNKVSRGTVTKRNQAITCVACIFMSGCQVKYTTIKGYDKILCGSVYTQTINKQRSSNKKATLVLAVKSTHSGLVSICEV